MNKSTVVPAVIGIAIAIVLALVVGGVVLAAHAMQSTATSGNSQDRDDDSDKSDDGGDEESDETGSDGDQPSGDPSDAMVYGDSDVVLVGYFDFMCPFCGEFVATNADQLVDLVDAGDLTVELRPISILDDSSEGTMYSTRAAAAFACEAELNPDDSFGYFLALFDNQPPEFTEGLTDNELSAIADDIGGQSIAECVSDGTWRDWVGDSTDVALDDDGITGTPSIFVNDTKYEGALDDAAEFADFVSTAG